MKAILQIRLIFWIVPFIPLLTFAQYSYDGWGENVEMGTAQYSEVWRLTLQKRLDKIDSLFMDSLLIRSQDGSISASKKYWRQSADTLVAGNTAVIRGPAIPLRRKFEYPDTVLLSKKIFNDQGLLVYSEGFFSGIDRPKKLYKTFKYDESGRLIEQIEVDNDSSHYYTFTYQFNDKEKTVCRSHLIHDEFAQYCIWKYDKKGNLKSIANYWAKGEELEWRSEYEHRNNGSLIIEKRFDDMDAAHKGSVHIKLDANSNELEKVFYSADNEFLQGSYYSYDASGNLTNEKCVLRRGEELEEIDHYEYSYNDENKLVQIEEIGSNGIRTILEQYFYESEGSMEYSFSHNKEGVPVTKYEYNYGKK